MEIFLQFMHFDHFSLLKNHGSYQVHNFTLIQCTIYTKTCLLHCEINLMQILQKTFFDILKSTAGVSILYFKKKDCSL